jgi:predicted MFS family arabinose efflux permease
MRILWTANSIAALGVWLLVMAVPLEVYRRSGSPVATGLALAIEALPAVVVGPWAGVLVDRLPRKRVLQGAYLGGAGGVALMLVGSIAAIYAGVLAEAVAATFLMPALRAITPGIAGAQLASFNASLSFTSGAFRMIGPPLGTLLATRGLFSLVVAFDILGYALAAVLIGRLSVPPGDTDAPPAGVREGVRLIRRTHMLVGLMVTSWLFLAGNAGVTALFVPFVAERLRQPGATGLLISALGVGYLAGSAVSKPLLDRCAMRPILIGAYAMVGASFLVLFNASTVAVAMVAIAVAGVPGSVVLVVIATRMQTATPDRALGRVAAAFSVSDATANLAGAVAAPVALAQFALGTALNLFTALVFLAVPATVFLLRGPRGFRQDQGYYPDQGPRSG